MSSTKKTPIATAAKTSGAKRKPPRSDRSTTISSASTTWPAMCGNGWRIVTTRTTTGRPSMALRGRQGNARNVSSAAVPGTTIRKIRARRTATGTRRTTGTTIPAFGSPGTLRPSSDRHKAPWAHRLNSRQRRASHASERSGIDRAAGADRRLRSAQGRLRVGVLGRPAAPLVIS